MRFLEIINSSILSCATLAMPSTGSGKHTLARDLKLSYNTRKFVAQCKHITRNNIKDMK